MNQEQNIKWDYRNEINKPLKGGSLLLAEPFMKDPYFMRATCFMVKHVKDDGSFGFILNKKTNKTLTDFIDIDLETNFDVFYGGPVGNDSIFFLHNNCCALNEANKVTENIYWNGDFEELIYNINLGKITPDDIIFFLGYSGWDKGQLRKEIIENSWIIHNDTNFNIKDISKNLWQNTLLKMGGIYSEFAHFPVDPSLN